HNYTLTFAAGQFPPVNAFWSVTMYDGKSQLLIKNPINRYLINSPMLPNMKKNADGSLTLLHSERVPWRGQEEQLAPCTKRFDLPRHAPLLAEDRAALDTPGWRRRLEAAGNLESKLTHQINALFTYENIDNPDFAQL